MALNDQYLLLDANGRPIPLQAFDSAANAYTSINPAATQGSAVPGVAATRSELIGGVFETTMPTLTNGQQVAKRVGARGQDIAAITDSASGNIASVTTGQNDGVGAGTLGLVTRSLASVFNGTAWDRLRGSVKGLFTVGSPLTFTSASSGTVGTSAAQLAPSNTARVYLQIINDTAADIWVNFTGTATSAPGTGNVKIASGTSKTWSGGAVPTNAISAIASAAGTAITVLEA